MRIRGGTWKNTDDEVLKAAVMKYGKNEWSRVSSLLVSKSARQCKARWNELLEPSIVKTEWTREETETLLQLARSLPAQWRTAAPAVGRTASQCLERYEKLLDAGCSVSEDGDPDPRKLRPRENDSRPESRPACPDPVDEENAILSRACARLGNTRGKRAKRKVRQKLLEEASRIASLRKSRELTAAGIATTKSSRSRGIHYNVEITFEKRRPPGFNDTADEDRVVVERPIEQIQGRRRRADVEAQLRKQDIGITRPDKLDMLSGNDELIAGGPSSPTRALLANYSRMSQRELSTCFHIPESTTGRNADPVTLEAPVQKLRSGPTGLPRPNNKYQIVHKSVHEEDEEVEEIEEDMSDRVASERAEEQARQELPLEKRTKVLRGELPRLSLASWDHLLMNGAEDKRSSLVPLAMVEQADELINKELLILLEHDNAKYPLDEEAAREKKTICGRVYNAKSAVCIPELEVFGENELKEAESLLKQETELLLAESGHKDMSLEDFVKVRNTCLEDLRFFPAEGRYGLASVASDSEELEALKNEFDNLKRSLGKAAEKATKSEQKILALSHGSILDGIWTQMEQNWRSLQCLDALQRQEHMAASSRVKCLTEEVNKQRELQTTLQRKYGNLLVELERINTLIEACPVADT